MTDNERAVWIATYAAAWAVDPAGARTEIVERCCIACSTANVALETLRKMAINGDQLSAEYGAAGFADMAREVLGGTP